MPKTKQKERSPERAVSQAETDFERHLQDLLIRMTPTVPNVAGEGTGQAGVATHEQPDFSQFIQPEAPAPTAAPMPRVRAQQGARFMPATSGPSFALRRQGAVGFTDPEQQRRRRVSSPQGTAEGSSFDFLLQGLARKRAMVLAMDMPITEKMKLLTQMETTQFNAMRAKEDREWQIREFEQKAMQNFHSEIGKLMSRDENLTFAQAAKQVLPTVGPEVASLLAKGLQKMDTESLQRTRGPSTESRKLDLMRDEMRRRDEQHEEELALKRAELLEARMAAARKESVLRQERVREREADEEKWRAMLEAQATEGKAERESREKISGAKELQQAARERKREEQYALEKAERAAAAESELAEAQGARLQAELKLTRDEHGEKMRLAEEEGRSATEPPDLLYRPGQPQAPQETYREPFFTFQPGQDFRPTEETRQRISEDVLTGKLASTILRQFRYMPEKERQKQADTLGAAGSTENRLARAISILLKKDVEKKDVTEARRLLTEREAAHILQWLIGETQANRNRLPETPMIDFAAEQRRRSPPPGTVTIRARGT